MDGIILPLGAAFKVGARVSTAPTVRTRQGGRYALREKDTGLLRVPRVEAFRGQDAGIALSRLSSAAAE